MCGVLVCIYSEKVWGLRTLDRIVAGGLLYADAAVARCDEVVLSKPRLHEERAHLGLEIPCYEPTDEAARMPYIPPSMPEDDTCTDVGLLFTLQEMSARTSRRIGETVRKNDGLDECAELKVGVGCAKWCHVCGLKWTGYP